MFLSLCKVFHVNLLKSLCLWPLVDYLIIPFPSLDALYQIIIQCPNAMEGWLNNLEQFREFHGHVME